MPQLFIGNSNAVPGFASSMADNFSLTNSTASTARSFSISNTGSGAASTAGLNSSSSNGDAFFQCNSGASLAACFGMDQSASLAKINVAAASSVDPSSGNIAVAYDTSGRIFTPNQPAFIASLANTLADVTGDNTDYTVLFDTVTQRGGTNYNLATGVFTAPVAGYYIFTANLAMSGMTSAFTNGNIRFTGSAGTRRFFLGNIGALIASGIFQTQGSTMFSMAAGATMSVVATVSGSTKTVDISSFTSWFTGFLIG